MSSPARPCLAVIDMQRVFAEPCNTGWRRAFGEIIGPVGKLVETFQPNVVFTRFIAPREWPTDGAALLPGLAVARCSRRMRTSTSPWTTFHRPRNWQTLDAVSVSDGAREHRDQRSGQRNAGAGRGGHRVCPCCPPRWPRPTRVSFGPSLRGGDRGKSARSALDILRMYAPLIEVVSLADQSGGMTGAQDRAAGAMDGLAIGDALGMPTGARPVAGHRPGTGRCQTSFSRAPRISRWPPVFRRREVTDDTEQTLLLARIHRGAAAGCRPRGVRPAVAELGRVDAAARLAQPSLGPSTKRALAALLDSAEEPSQAAMAAPTVRPCGSPGRRGDPLHRSGPAGASPSWQPAG